MDCCAQSHAPELGQLLRILRSLALVAWRALTYSYSDVGASAIFILTFLWVLVFQKGTPISSSQDAQAVTTRRGA